MEKRLRVSRRRVLTGGGAALAAALVPVRADAGWAQREWTAAEQANVKVANALLKAWETKDADGLARLFAADGKARTTAHTMQPAVNPQGLKEAAAKFFATGGVQFKVLETVAQGPLVVNLRIDRITSKDGLRDLHYSGVFLIKDGKIQEWNDYEVAPATPVKPGQPL